MRTSYTWIWTAAAALAVPSGVLADPMAAYPAKQVRIVIGPTGNFTDIITRQLSQRLQERWQPSWPAS